MTSMIRFAVVLGGVAILAVPAYSQDGGRRGDGAPGGGPFGGPGRFGGFGRGMIQPPRMGPPPGPGWQDEAFQKTVDLGAQGTFELKNSYGQIRINGGDGNKVRIAAIKRVKEPNRDAAKALMQNIVIRVTERGGGVEVFTENPAGSTTPTLVDYEIGLPASASVSVRSQGSIFISNVKGDVRAEAYQSDIVLNGVARVRRAKAYIGSVSIRDAEGEEIEAEASGLMVINNVHARTIEARTIAGITNAFYVDCDRCTLSSVTGDINFVGPLRRTGRYDISTNSGNIRLATDGNTGFDLEAVSNTGTPRSDFTLKSTTPASAASGGRILRGSYGDGSAILSLRSFGGNVTVTRQMQPGPGGR